MLTAAQLKRRRNRITSSVAAGALGLHERMSPLQAWLSVKGELKVEETKAMERGNFLEELLLSQALKYPTNRPGLDLKYRKAPFRVHPQHKRWAADSCDARYYRGNELVAIGEGKTANAGIAQHYHEEGTDDIPRGTLLQSHWHLAHWPEVDICYVPVLVAGFSFEFRLYEVHRDDELEGIMLQDLEKWHRDHIVADRMPVANEQDAEVLKYLYPRELHNRTVATRELHQLCIAKYLAHERMKAAKTEHERFVAQLKQTLGTFAGATGDWGRVDFKCNKDSTVVDWEAIARELGATEDIISQHTKIKPGARPLNVRFNADEIARINCEVAA